MTLPGGALAIEGIDPRELRALEAVQAAETLDAWRDKFKRYGTTAHFCQCPDYQFHWRRGTPCKHMLALRLLKVRTGGMQP